MKYERKQILYAVTGLLLAAAVLYFGVLRTDAIRVETGTVSRGELIASIDAEGKTRYHERYSVTAPISGKMFRIQLHEGDRVPKGYVLTRIDPSPPRPLDPSRTPEPGVYPFAYNVYIPENGILTKIFVTSEGIVQAGTVIAEISKPSQLEIVADVLSSDATRISPHLPVLIENWGGEGALKAQIRIVEPQAFTKVSALGVEEQRVNVIADFVSEPGSLGDNYRVDVRIVLWEGRNVLRVPASALFRQGDEWRVFVVESSRARSRSVEIGHRSPSFVEVIGGVSEGETVILHPPNNVTEGSRITAE